MSISVFFVQRWSKCGRGKKTEPAGEGGLNPVIPVRDLFLPFRKEFVKAGFYRQPNRSVILKAGFVTLLAKNTDTSVAEISLAPERLKTVLSELFRIFRPLPDRGGYWPAKRESTVYFQSRVVLIRRLLPDKMMC
jgi:hypothetical protein